MCSMSSSVVVQPRLTRIVELAISVRNSHSRQHMAGASTLPDEQAAPALTS